MMGISFSGDAFVSWINTEKKYDKPVGFGVSFENLKRESIYNFLLLGPQTLL